MKSSSKNGYCYDIIVHTGKSFIFDKKIGIGQTIIKKDMKIKINIFVSILITLLLIYFYI